MGKNSRKTKQKRRTQTKSEPKSHSSYTDATGRKSGKYNVDQLLERVDEYMDTFQYEMAQKFCQRALEMEPDNVRVLEVSGTLLLEVGELEKAKQCFGRAITVSPEEGHSKYMYMGQLMTGVDSIQYFMKGIQLMKKHIEDLCSQKTTEAACASKQEEDSDEITHQDVSSAYCSVAEIYLTDQCFEDEAEDRCADCLDNALKEDKDNAEAYHLYASYWLSKDQKQKAQESMKRGLSLWLPTWRDACENTGKDGGGESTIDLTDTCSLSYPARINVTKTLIELEDYDTASEILELLLDEEDEVVETWYLLGWINTLQSEDCKQNARYYLGKAQKLAVSTKCEDKGLVTHVNELLTELGGPVDDDPEERECENGDMEIHSDSEDDQDQQNHTEDNTSNSMEH